MDIHVFHHIADDERRLFQILDYVKRIYLQGERIMGKIDDLNAELAKINDTTNEIAADIDDLLKQAEGGVSESDAAAFQAKLSELSDRLKGVAAKHDTPPAP